MYAGRAYGVPVERSFSHSFTHLRAVVKTTGATFPAIAVAAADFPRGLGGLASSHKKTSCFIARFSVWSLLAAARCLSFKTWSAIRSNNSSSIPALSPLERTTVSRVISLARFRYSPLKSPSQTYSVFSIRVRTNFLSSERTFKSNAIIFSERSLTSAFAACFQLSKASSRVAPRPMICIASPVSRPEKKPAPPGQGVPVVPRRVRRGSKSCYRRFCSVPLGGFSKSHARLNSTTSPPAASLSK